MADDACLAKGNHIRTKLPTMAQAIDIITMQIDRREQGRQLAYMAETQGKDFAQTVHDKVKAAGGLKNK